MTGWALPLISFFFFFQPNLLELDEILAVEDYATIRLVLQIGSAAWWVSETIPEYFGQIWRATEQMRVDKVSQMFSWSFIKLVNCGCFEQRNWTQTDGVSSLVGSCHRAHMLQRLRLQPGLDCTALTHPRMQQNKSIFRSSKRLREMCVCVYVEHVPAKTHSFRGVRVQKYSFCALKKTFLLFHKDRICQSHGYL